MRAGGLGGDDVGTDLEGNLNLMGYELDEVALKGLGSDQTSAHSVLRIETVPQRYLVTSCSPALADHHGIMSSIV